MSEFHSHPYFLTPRRLNPGYPLFVFLPGMDESTSLAHLQTTTVETGFDVRTLVIPPDFSASWDILAQQVVALTTAELEKVPRQSAYLCGQCFGACLVLKVMLRAPKLFNRFILINSASSFNFNPWFHWGSLLTPMLPKPLYKMLSITGLPILASLKQMTQANRQALLESICSVPLKTSIQHLSLLRRFNVDEKQLHQVTKPVLIVASNGDRLFPSLAEARRLVKIFPNAQLVTLPSSGHACLLEADVNLYEIMQSENFLDNLN